ncbi:MAG TPA: DUF3352 domain-containing protein [Pyrinomonadaceae bacterium]|nr:DUF3352 domain-containing protein [Pyrinomonadaceae bacterium]
MKYLPPVVRYRGASLVVAVSLLLVPFVHAQRPAPKPARPATRTTTQTPVAERSPSVTLDTLLSADAYGVYAEMRAVGRHANSQEIAQLLAPFGLEGSGAPAELLALYEFIKSHADALMTARLMFAAMPARAGVPETLLAVEMPSVEEARKFVPELKQFVAANVAPPTKTAPTVTTSLRVESSNTARRRGARRAQATAENATDDVRAKPPAAPQFQIKRSGSVVALSGAAFTFKDLHGTDQALLVNEPGFQAARTRFGTDTLFVYFNTVRMTNSMKQRMEALEKEYRRQEELARAEAEKRGARSNSYSIVEPDTIGVISGGDVIAGTDANKNANVSVRTGGNMNTTNANVSGPPEDETPPIPPTPEATPSPKSEKELEEERRREQSRRFAETLGSFVFGGRGMSEDSWPESIGVGASLDGDALVVRGLFIDLSGDQPPRPIPFLPVLLSGPAIAAEASAVLPADTDIFVSVSLDLPQMYDYLASLMKIADLAGAQEDGKGGFGEQLTAFEKTNNFRIREDLLAALGNEIAVGVPPNGFFGMRPLPRSDGDPAAPPPSGPVVVVALNDRESLQKLLPRILNSIGLAGATEQSIVEKHGQVEVLTFSNGTLAFIDRFLVGAPDAATMRRVAEAYNSGETLANSAGYRDPTRWQSKQAIGQVYASNAMLKGMFEDVTKSVEDIDDPAVRAHIMRLDPNPGAITHLATRESDGLMHELRLPKNLLSLFATSSLVSQKLSTVRGNEAMARWKLHMIKVAQDTHKEKTGRYGTLEELIAAAKLVNDENKDSGRLYEDFTFMEAEGYEINVSASGDTFAATATPTGYPKLGRRSFYIDQTGSLRGGDTGGKPASASTSIIE